jgi:hypothetical protein
MKPGRAGTMTHDYKRNGTTTLFAALNILDGTVIGHNRKRHRHQEFIRFLNDIDAQVPRRKTVHAIVDNYGTHKHPRAQMARPASPLDLPLHADLGVLAQCHRRFLRQAHQPAPQARRVPIRPGTSGRNRSLRRGNQRRSQTLRMVGTPKPHPRRCQKREGKVRVDPLGIRWSPSYTLLVIMPVNRKLMATELSSATGETTNLIRHWARLHAGRTVLGMAATAVFLWASLS